jgi:Rap1a immunity proteins
MKWFLCTIFISLILASQAHAMDGNQFKKLCGSKESAAQFMCGSYLAGFIDGLDWGGDHRVCVPSNATLDQVGAVVEKSLTIRSLSMRPSGGLFGSLLV